MTGIEKNLRGCELGRPDRRKKDEGSPADTERRANHGRRSYDAEDDGSRPPA